MFKSYIDFSQNTPSMSWDNALQGYAQKHCNAIVAQNRGLWHRSDFWQLQIFSSIQHFIATKSKLDFRTFIQYSGIEWLISSSYSASNDRGGSGENLSMNQIASRKVCDKAGGQATQVRC